jgi:hypothetical protein
MGQLYFCLHNDNGLFLSLAHGYLSWDLFSRRSSQKPQELGPSMGELSAVLDSRGSQSAIFIEARLF